jgi:2-dehydro-3-deoxygalactonokinase
LIAVDWGTSNFRAFRLSADGAVLARRSSPQGILRVGNGNFAEALRAEIGAWLAEGETKVLLCGMIGSRQGWVEAQYLSCPVDISDLASAVVEVPFSGAEVWLVPGVIGPDAAGVPELMRGEETAAMGIQDACGGAGLVCSPGTHSKWIQVSERKIKSFTTCMTGEIYSAVRKCTILGRMMTSNAAIDKTAFHDGVARSADPGGLLHHLFGVRTLALMGQLKEEASASYLSGLLIGHEVRAAMVDGGVVHLVGAAMLCGLYAQAIEACGGRAKLEDEDAAALGLAAIGRRLHWT